MIALAAHAGVDTRVQIVALIITAVMLGVAAAAVLISAPVVLWLPHGPILGPLLARVLISHYVFGGLLLLGALCVSRWVREQPGHQQIDDQVAGPAPRPS